MPSLPSDLVTSTVLENSPDASAGDHTKRDMDYKAAFPGIYWDQAETTCEDWELAILIEATRMANEMVNKFANSNWWWDSPAWNRYFLRDSKAYPPRGWHGDEQSQNTIAQISNNIRQVAAFPTTGKRNKAGQQGRRQKLAYTCRAPSPPARRSDCQWDDPAPGKKWTGPSAQTYRPDANNNEGYVVVFCPRFFKDGDLRYINEITKLPKSETSLPTLRSYEWVIAHEWMHATLFGYAAPILDLQANLGQGVVPIHGDENCHKYAWLYYDSSRAVNLGVVENADNYAWMFQYNWFINAFGWKCK